MPEIERFMSSQPIFEDISEDESTTGTLPDPSILDESVEDDTPALETASIRLGIAVAEREAASRAPTPERATYPCMIVETAIHREVDQRPPGSAFQELTPVQLRVISNAIAKDNGAVLHTITNVPITPKDITTLTGNSWLNDAVMDGYLALVNDENFESSNFTIYFYRALIKKTNEEMLRWTKKTSLFGTRLVHIPVNDSGTHWCMATIDNQEKTVTVRDSIRGTEGDFEIRHILDNIKTIMRYDILMNPQSSGYNVQDYQFIHDRTMPKQDDSYNCGVFALQAARYVSAHKPITFTRDDMPYFRQRMQYELLTRTLMPID
jgi:sentrin-specific protease 1